MPIEQQDNTRVAIQPIVLNYPAISIPIRVLPPQNQDQLWDSEKIQLYDNLQNFYNNNVFWNYGVNRVQTNFDPRTAFGRSAIESNFNYAKGNAQNFAEQLLTYGALEGIGQAFRWATTPRQIGSGAEAVVYSAPISPRVTKTTTIPISEMQIRNMVPGAVESTYVNTNKGLITYTQPKIRILNNKQLAKAQGEIDKLMTNNGWTKITHPNLNGPGYTNGKWVVSDLGQGNVGRDWLGRVRFPDFSIETVPEFRLAMQKQGGRLINNN